MQSQARAACLRQRMLQSDWKDDSRDDVKSIALSGVILEARQVTMLPESWTVSFHAFESFSKMKSHTIWTELAS